jgi:hypothetical protein
MREIFFRGKREKDGNWAVGFLTSGHEYLAHIRPLHRMVEYKVIPETVGQYTGVKDKNGVKIFEGDIVEDNGGYRSVVEYVNGGFHSQDDAYSIDYYARLLCVIGAIHDNPELLKGKNI